MSGQMVAVSVKALSRAAALIATASADPALALTPEQIYAKVSSSVGVVFVFDADRNLISQGSAVVVAKTGMITNRHVIQHPRASAVGVLLGRAVHVVGDVQCDSRGRDLCLLEIRSLDAPAVEFGVVENLKVGQAAYAVGAPKEIHNLLAVYQGSGQVTEAGLTLSAGIVSSLRRGDDGVIIQTSAPVSSGSSGGGLFDDDGRLIGITTFKTVGGENLNMALPVTWVAEMGVVSAVQQATLVPDLPQDRQRSVPSGRAPSGGSKGSNTFTLWLVFLAVAVVLLATSKRLIRWINDALGSRVTSSIPEPMVQHTPTVRAAKKSG